MFVKVEVKETKMVELCPVRVHTPVAYNPIYSLCLAPAVDTFEELLNDP